MTMNKFALRVGLVLIKKTDLNFLRVISKLVKQQILSKYVPEEDIVVCWQGALLPTLPSITPKIRRSDYKLSHE